MKKLFVVAIILAALGGALYYYFEMRTSKPSPVSFQEQLIGTWKMDSVALGDKDSGNVIGLMILALDSNYLNYTYTFATDDVVEKKLGDSIVEKLNYKLQDSVRLTFIATDSTKEEFNNTIISFDKQQLILRASDSSLLFFKRK
jgi:hypothetical protein